MATVGPLFVSIALGILSVNAQAGLAQDTALSTASRGKSEADKWREDLRFMAEEMSRHHRNLFHTMTREEFESAVRRLDERIPSLARHQIIVAMVGDGHTNLAPTRDSKIGFRAYPIKLSLFKDGLYVRAVTREHADIVGARVVGIGKVSADAACDAVGAIIGRDNAMDVKFFAPFLLAMPEVLHGLGLIDDMENAPFTIADRGGPRVVNLKPAGPAPMMAPDTDLSWLSTPNWVDARDGAQDPVPLWLRDPQNKYWFEYLPGARTVYVQFNQVGNKQDETIEAFAKRLFAFVESRRVERLVLDLRLNRGGNGALNRPLLLGLIRATKVDRKGRLFAIIGRSTWSAAQGLVNELEKYTNTTFVGEPTGGKPNSYGDSHRITLPNSGITVRVSTLWWQGDERDRRPWTAPEVAADLTFEDYRTNKDPALKAALAYVPTKSLPELLKEALSANDLRRVVERDREWRADPANAYFDTEASVNSLGYELLAAGRVDQAIAVFRLNAAAYPRSANAYDSLGEAYKTKGDREAAIKSYEKALALDPNQRSASEALRTLRGK
jgi:hypothetical protein